MRGVLETHEAIEGYEAGHEQWQENEQHPDDHDTDVRRHVCLTYR